VNAGDFEATFDRETPQRVVTSNKRTSTFLAARIALGKTIPNDEQLRNLAESYLMEINERKERQRDIEAAAKGARGLAEILEGLVTPKRAKPVRCGPDCNC